VGIEKVAQDPEFKYQLGDHVPEEQVGSLRYEIKTRGELCEESCEKGELDCGGYYAASKAVAVYKLTGTTADRDRDSAHFAASTMLAVFSVFDPLLPTPSDRTLGVLHSGVGVASRRHVEPNLLSRWSSAFHVSADAACEFSDVEPGAPTVGELLRSERTSRTVACVYEIHDD
jgi:hypothetical protein